MKGYVSDLSVLLGAESFVFADGKGKGVRAVRMYNGKLDLTVLLDRCMDIFRLFYRGKPVSFITKNGLVSPALAGTGVYPFGDCFGGGFLYTCGPDNVGAPEERDGRRFPQHGSASCHPAENVHIERSGGGENAVLSLVGEMRFSSLFGQNLVMRREISLRAFGDTLRVRDTLVNEGYTDANYLLMYHVNLGYPVLDEHAALAVDAEGCRRVSETGNGETMRFEPPTPGRPEEVYCHTLRAGEGIKAALKNSGFTLAFRFDAEQFPYLVEWKSMASGDYVLGLEPVTTPYPARSFRTLRPGERAAYGVCWEFSDI